MRLVQFRSKADPRVARMGALLNQGRFVLDLAATLDGQGKGGWLPSPTSCEWWNLDGSLAQLVRSACEVAQKADENTVAQWHKAGRVFAADDVQLLAPIPRPGKLLCIGRNYQEHALEQGADVPTSPIIFSKFATAIVGPGDPVVIPKGCEKPDWEAELAVVIGRRAKNVTVDRAMDHVFGYVCFNDVSARDYQAADGQWQRAKSCDTFAPMGPAVVSKDEVDDPNRLAIKLTVNGQVMQDSSTQHLIFKIPQLIAFISNGITLEPGDVIATGTPSGVGFARKPPIFLKPGDTMSVEIAGLGQLTNPVTAPA